MNGSRFLILADGEFGPLTSKTANSVIRYLPDRVVAVVDGGHAGQTVQDVLEFGGAIPVVRSMREGLAFKPDAVLIGIAPIGGKLPIRIPPGYPIGHGIVLPDSTLPPPPPVAPVITP